MNKDKRYDLVVVGAGPGGYVAALRAAQLGLSAVVVERDKPGGVCLNIGCIPSKALIHQAEQYRSLDQLEGFGIAIDRSGFDYAKVQAQSRQAATQLSKGIEFLLKKAKVDYVSDEVTKVRQGAVELREGGTLEAKHILVATGSRPRDLPAFPIDEEKILSSTGILLQTQLPKSILILGSGAIGTEFAHILASFGVEVHLVEMLDSVLPLEDPEHAEILARSFTKRGIKLYTSTRAESQTATDDGFEVLLVDGDKQEQRVQVEQILVSVGRVPNTESLGLEEAGVVRDAQGFIEVDRFGQTAVEGSYAIGDIVRTPLLAHVASREGEIAVEHMAGREPLAVDPLSIPAATYCEPQLASFGYSEARAAEEGREVKVLRFPYVGIGKAVATESAEGQVKLILDAETEELIGGHIVGAEATELIHELLLTRSAELLPDDVIHMIHAHPTLSEGLAEAIRQARDGALHI